MSYNHCVSYLAGCATPASQQPSPRNIVNPNPINVDGGGDVHDPDVDAQLEAKNADPIDQELESADANMAADLERKEAIQDWFRNTAGQLTHFGLSRLHEIMKKEELGVLFRNNHFSVVLKKGPYLFSLVSDLGVVESYPSVMWQRISDIDGDDFFLTSAFRDPNQPPPPSSAPPPQTAMHNPNHVYQQQQRQAALGGTVAMLPQHASAPEQYPVYQDPYGNGSHRRPPTHPRQKKKKKKDSCCIL